MIANAGAVRSELLGHRGLTKTDQIHLFKTGLSCLSTIGRQSLDKRCELTLQPPAGRIAGGGVSNAASTKGDKKFSVIHVEESSNTNQTN